MPKTVITLYKCYQCGRTIYEKDIAIGKVCKCGSNKIRLADPTLWLKIKFFINNPEYFKILVRENVLNRG